MERVDITDEHFDTIDFAKVPLALGDYENCTFINCNFANVSLFNFLFADCTFIDSNISLANLANTILRDIHFKGCKLLGLHFEYCKPMLFKVDFDNCILNLSSFYKLNCKQTKFINCSMQEVDLTETDISNSLFDNCDLHAAVFENTILEKADLRTAFNFSIDPEKNRIKKAKFSLQGLAGLLGKYDIEIE